MKIVLIVEEVLRDFPETRSSDKQLIVKAWESMGLFLSESQKSKFYQLPSDETITRVRRQIQAQGRFKASESMARRRRIKSMEVQQNAPTSKPGRLEDVLRLFK